MTQSSNNSEIVLCTTPVEKVIVSILEYTIQKTNYFQNGNSSMGMRSIDSLSTVENSAVQKKERF